MFANIQPENILRIFFATVLVWLGIGMIRRSRHADSEVCDLEE
jgi:threonine/homoserine/homoserine lactone efflux protein